MNRRNFLRQLSIITAGLLVGVETNNDTAKYFGELDNLLYEVGRNGGLGESYFVMHPQIYKEFVDIGWVRYYSLATVT